MKPIAKAIPPNARPGPKYAFAYDIKKKNMNKKSFSIWNFLECLLYRYIHLCL